MGFDKKTLRCYHQKFCGGKNLFARIFDRVTGTLALCCILLLLLLRFRFPLSFAFILSLLLCGSFLLFCTILHRYRFTRYLSAQYERIQKALLLESLLMLPDPEYHALCAKIFAQYALHDIPKSVYGGWYFPKSQCFCYAFRNHPKVPVGIHQMFRLYRTLQTVQAKECILLAAAPYVDDAQTFSRRFSIRVTLLDQQKLITDAAVLLPVIPHEDIILAAAQEMAQYRQKQDLRHKAVSPGKYRAYLLCAFLLLCWYFLFGRGILYLIFAGICVILALLSHRAQRKAALRE